ncbi:MAG: TonB-dependent receptor [Gammaproteobacteria bacterium]|nr:MAG: TonB-dependent receptor [Gammaproteobacteria bacterium]
MKLIKFLSFLILFSTMVHCLAAIDAKDLQRRALIEQLKNLTLTELSEVETFNPKAGLAARKLQKLTDTAAALFVITQEDIRRAGITHLAEALRMVPGVQVARINASTWAISARGFNGMFASKLLVMIDGRNVYTLLRSEVFWDVQDTLLEDVDRIEVIRGPGASLWGANAVNGIINIITKSADKTQGNLVTTTFGDGEERTIIGVRHGGTLNDDTHYRIYGKFYEHDSFLNAAGNDQQDRWHQKRAGFRIDQETTTDDNLTFQGDIYQGFAKQQLLDLIIGSPFIDQTKVSGFNLLGRWQRQLDNGDMSLQTYYDHTKRNEITLGDHRGIFDIDFQHRLQYSEKQEYIWGLGYRYSHDNMDNSISVSYLPEKRQDHLFSAFVQGEFMLQPERLKLTLGSKFEHNDYSGFEIQPTTRLLWTLNNKHSVWAAISRAVRSPARTDENIQYILPATASIAIIQKAHRDYSNADLDQIKTQIIQGNLDYQSETVLAYELGYRFNLTNRFMLDTSLFYNEYNHLRILEFAEFISPEMILIKNMNKMYGEAYGLEIAASWQVRDNWKLITTYSYLDLQLHLEPGTLLVPPMDSFYSEQEEGDNPHHQASIRSLLTLPYNLELDTALYYVDNVPNQLASNYTRFDVRLGWHSKEWEMSLGARNLFDNQHREFGDSASGNYTPADEVQRSIYMQLKYRF